MTHVHTNPVSLRVSVTDRCDLHCRYCRGPEGVPIAPGERCIAYEEIVAFVRLLARGFGLSKVRITGGEPLVRRDIVDLVDMLARLNLPDLALTTNGQRLSELAAPLREAGLDRVNVSLDSLDPETYRTLTRGGDLKRTLAGIEAALAAGLAPVKLNAVVLRGINDGEVAALARYGLDRGCPVRFLELMPIGVAGPHLSEWFVPSDEVRAALCDVFDLQPLPWDTQAASRDFAVTDAAGREGVVGFISPCSNAFCAGCRRLRLTASGKLLGCLAQVDGIDVKPILHEGDATRDARLVEAVHAALRLKRNGRRFGDQKSMVRIGG